MSDLVFVAVDAKPTEVAERLAVGHGERDGLAAVLAQWARAAALVAQPQRARARAHWRARPHVEVRSCQTIQHSQHIV